MLDASFYYGERGVVIVTIIVFTRFQRFCTQFHCFFYSVSQFPQAGGAEGRRSWDERVTSVWSLGHVGASEVSDLEWSRERAHKLTETRVRPCTRAGAGARLHGMPCWPNAGDLDLDACRQTGDAGDGTLGMPWWRRHWRLGGSDLQVSCWPNAGDLSQRLVGPAGDAGQGTSQGTPCWHQRWQLGVGNWSGRRAMKTVVAQACLASTDASDFFLRGARSTQKKF